MTPHDMPRTLLILAFGDLGDTILTVPAIRALRERFPDARLLLLAKAGPGALVCELGLVDELVLVDKHVFDRARALLRPGNQVELLRLVWRLRRARPEIVVVFGHLVTAFGALKYGLLTLASGATRRVGLDNGRGWFLTERAIDEGFGVKHEAQYWLDVAARLGARGDLLVEFAVSETDRQAATELLQPVSDEVGSLVAIHPSTGWYAPGRKWEPARFAGVADTLHCEAGCRCVVVGSHEDRADVNRMLDAARSPILDLAGKTTLGQLAAVLQRCDLVIANDGGVGHLASAVATPVVSIFGPSNDEAWRPLSSTVVAADLPCRPCLYRDFERGLPNGCGTRQCLQLVTVDTVTQTAKRVLREQAARAV